MENNIKLSSANQKYKMENVWPRTKEDCRIGFNSGSIASCDIAYDGGSENINKLCTSLWDESYNMDILITEVDSTSANDLSSLHIPYSAMPRFSTDKISRYTMKQFIKEVAGEQEVQHEGCVKIDFTIAFGIGIMSGPMKAGLGVTAGFKYEDCSEWKEIPGGYTLHMSVYNYNDPSYDLAYSMTNSWVSI